MEQNLEIAIKSEIEQVFGRRVVSSRDCIELSDDIYHKTKFQLNSNTLRRFFSLVKAAYPPSQSTLSILSKYCGFHSPDDLLSIKKNTPSQPADMVNRESVLHHLVSMLIIEVKDGDDETFLNIVSQIIEFVTMHQFLADRFQSLISKTENGVKFYFEQFVNIDKLNSFYGDGLRYYIKGKGTEDAQAYATSIYILKDWLNGNDEGLKRNMSQLLQERHVNFEQSFMYARYFAALLLNANLLKTDTYKILADIQDFHHSLVLEYQGTRVHMMFNYIICEVLALTGYYEEVLHYFQLVSIKKFVAKDGPLNYFHNLLLLEAFSLYKLGQYNQAEKVFDKIKASKFCFLNTKFSHIIYLYLLRAIKPKNKGYDEQIQSLIAETGFLKLNDLFG